jgi:hypothetical protein
MMIRITERTRVRLCLRVAVCASAKASATRGRPSKAQEKINSSSGRLVNKK